MSNTKTTTYTKGNVTITEEVYFKNDGDVWMVHTTYIFNNYAVHQFNTEDSTSYYYYVDAEENSYHSAQCEGIAEFVYYLVKQTRSSVYRYDAEMVLNFINWMKW